MVTQDEAVKAMNSMVDCLPDRLPNDWYFLCSMEIAQHLMNFAYEMKGELGPIMHKGEKFKWKGINCMVV